jgi:hypothetical protein
MEFKINKQKRVRIPISKLYELKRYSREQNFFIFLWSFEEESGLKGTSTRVTRFQNVIYFFKIVDTKKYMLAKIKHGI